MISQIAVILEFLILIQLQLCDDKKYQLEFYALALITQLFVKPPTGSNGNPVRVRINCVLGIINTIIACQPIIATLTQNPIHHQHHYNSALKIILSFIIITQVTKNTCVNMSSSQNNENFQRLGKKNTFLRVLYYSPLTYTFFELSCKVFLTSLFLEIHVHEIELRVNKNFKLYNLALVWFALIPVMFYQILCLIESLIYLINRSSKTTQTETQTKSQTKTGKKKLE